MPKRCPKPRAVAACCANGEYCGVGGQVCRFWIGAANPVWLPHPGQNGLGWLAVKPQREHCTRFSSVVWNRLQRAQGSVQWLSKLYPHCDQIGNSAGKQLRSAPSPHYRGLPLSYGPSSSPIFDLSPTTTMVIDGGFRYCAVIFCTSAGVTAFTLATYVFR
jgi:hypothetical protein